MRSRYSAFCTKNVDYLLATHHRSQQHADEKTLLENSINATEWLGLKVLKATQQNESGVVEFIAYYRDQHGLGQIHERSNFVLEENRWFYFDGKHLPAEKIQRNDPCICGSGKKFKKCCGSASD